MRLLHSSLGSPAMPQSAPAPSTKAKTFQKAKSLLSFRHQGSAAGNSGASRNSMLPGAYPAFPQGKHTCTFAVTLDDLVTSQCTVCTAFWTAYVDVSTAVWIQHAFFLFVPALQEACRIGIACYSGTKHCLGDQGAK